MSDRFRVARDFSGRAIKLGGGILAPSVGRVLLDTLREPARSAIAIWQNDNTNSYCRAPNPTTALLGTVEVGKYPVALTFPRKKSLLLNSRKNQHRLCCSYRVGELLVYNKGECISISKQGGDVPIKFFLCPPCLVCLISKL